MLIDGFLPRWDVVERHETAVEADPARAWHAVLAVDLSRSWLVKALFFLRGLHRGPHTLERMVGLGFTELGRDEGVEIVLGLVGRPWRPRADLRRVADFSAFDEPNYVKIAWNFTVEPDGEGARVRTQTRILATDEPARRRFGRYWMVVGRFSGLVRSEALRLIKQRAERG